VQCNDGSEARFTFNALSMLSGYGYGKTPLQTFFDSATLAYDKQLDRIKPALDPVAVAA
jgi:hypothetical protein